MCRFIHDGGKSGAVVYGAVNIQYELGKYPGYMDNAVQCLGRRFYEATSGLGVSLWT